MPNDNKTKGNLNWPPERTCKYSISEREAEIEAGEYIEIPIMRDERDIEGRE